MIPPAVEYVVRCAVNGGTYLVAFDRELPWWKARTTPDDDDVARFASLEKAHAAALRLFEVGQPCAIELVEPRD